MKAGRRFPGWGKARLGMCWVWEGLEKLHFSGSRGYMEGILLLSRSFFCTNTAGAETSGSTAGLLSYMEEGVESPFPLRRHRQ